MMNQIKGMTTCKICNRNFPLLSEDRYTVRDNVKTGLSAAFSGNEENLFDAMDCPHCGCQNILNPRKRIFLNEDKITIEIDEGGEEDE